MLGQVVLVVKNLPANAVDTCSRQKRCGFDPWVWKIPWGREWQSTPVFIPGKSHGQRSLPGGLQSTGSQRVRCDLVIKQQR